MYINPPLIVGKEETSIDIVYNTHHTVLINQEIFKIRELEEKISGNTE